MSSSAPVWARYDDIRAGVGWLFDRPCAVLAAYHASEVLGVLAGVERHTADGKWAFGYLAYEAAAGLDPDLTVVSEADEKPLAWFAICDAPQQVAAIAPPAGPPAYEVQPWQPDGHVSDYLKSIAVIREQIARGQIYQCNLTSKLHSHLSGELEQFYADLAYRQNGSYAAYLDLGSQVIVSASPEMFFTWTGDRLSVAPMKGTTARGRTTDEDRTQLQRLVSSPKERAENIMIVDLLRNDLGRIAEPGSVKVTSLCRAERYETVWQLTSEVTAVVAAETSIAAVFSALFPSGSVTGAPKIAAMKLIAEVEGTARGVYCGAVGFVGPKAATLRARFIVPIRTVVIDRPCGTATYGTGGGITWDSDPTAEREEMLLKARILSSRYEAFQLFETVGFEQHWRHLDRHLRRMADSARYFGWSFDAQLAREMFEKATPGPGRSRGRLVLARDARLTLDVEPLVETAQKVVSLTIDDIPIDATQPWFFHKTTRRRDYDERALRHPEADDVLLINGAGEITESTVANFALCADGIWYTPPVSCGCLPGIERGRLLEAGQLLERVLTASDVHCADQLAVLSSLRGWRPAVLRK